MHDLTFSKFQPLESILSFDDFDRGSCGWIGLTPNFTQAGFNPRKSFVDKTQWGPMMLSTATFPFVGTHGSMDGLYSLKLATRPVASPYQEPPAPGSLSHAIKRLSRHRPFDLLQLEMFYAYTPEQDRIGLGEKDIRAFGVLFDLQDSECRSYAGLRYLNSVNGDLKRRWQYVCAAPVSDKEWAYGQEGEWNKRGIDPMWYGRRREDGSTDGFREVPEGEQALCYNESDDKINWLYLRLLLDVRKRTYVEFQSGQRVFDMRGLPLTESASYNNIDGLLNPILWIENDTDRRVFLFVDSVLLSVQQESIP